MKTGAIVRVALKRIEKNQTEETTDDPISQLQKVAIFRTGSERDYLCLSDKKADKKAAFVPSKVGCRENVPLGALQPSTLQLTREFSRPRHQTRNPVSTSFQRRLLGPYAAAVR